MRQTSGEAQDSGERKPNRINMFLTVVLTLHQAGRFMCISSVQSLSRVQLFEAPWTAARQASLSIPGSQSLLKLMSIVLVMPSNHLILTCVSVFITHTRTVETMASILQINLFCRGHAWASPTPRRRLFQGSRPRIGNRVDSQIPQLLDVCVHALSVMSDSLRPHGT